VENADIRWSFGAGGKDNFPEHPDEQCSYENREEVEKTMQPARQNVCRVRRQSKSCKYLASPAGDRIYARNLHAYSDLFADVPHANQPARQCCDNKPVQQTLDTICVADMRC
jgi:hypothetical protein